MGEESDHVHIIALSDALGVPIRVVYLDRSTYDIDHVIVNHHDFIPSAGDLPSAGGGSSETTKPIVTLLYRPGHYDILYLKWSSPVLVKLLSWAFFFVFRVMEFFAWLCMYYRNWKCPGSWICIGRTSSSVRWRLELFHALHAVTCGPKCWYASELCKWGQMMTW